MIARFYAKIKLHYREIARVRLVAVPTFGNNETEAKYNVETMVSKWDGLHTFELLTISKQPIFLSKHIIEGLIKYRVGSTKRVKIIVNVEDENEAETLFREITSQWRNVVSLEITNTLTITDYERNRIS